MIVMNTEFKRAVILVGHGAIPTDYPLELFARQRSLESTREAQGGDPTREELELDHKIRRWPRTAATDPYQAGLEALASHLKRSLDGDLFAIAYNEFCAPTLEEAVQAVIAQGARQIRIVPSMLTPGGSHSEREIPAALAQLRITHPGIDFRYAWPFDLQQVASMLASQLNRF
jgi:sirohydrochlorin cobaltochelatase